MRHKWPKFQCDSLDESLKRKGLQIFETWHAYGNWRIIQRDLAEENPEAHRNKKKKKKAYPLQ